MHPTKYRKGPKSDDKRFFVARQQAMVVSEVTVQCRLRWLVQIKKIIIQKSKDVHMFRVCTSENYLIQFKSTKIVHECCSCVCSFIMCIYKGLIKNKKIQSGRFEYFSLSLK